MSTTKRCRICGKAYPREMYIDPRAACDVCRTIQACARDPRSTIHKAQLRRACERAGDITYADACAKVLEGIGTAGMAAKVQRLSARQAERAMSEQQRRAMDSMRARIAELEELCTELTEKLANERNAHAETRRKVAA